MQVIILEYTNIDQTRTWSFVETQHSLLDVQGWVYMKQVLVLVVMFNCMRSSEGMVALGPCKSDRIFFGPISVRFYFFLGEYLIEK